MHINNNQRYPTTCRVEPRYRPTHGLTDPQTINLDPASGRRDVPTNWEGESIHSHSDNINLRPHLYNPGSKHMSPDTQHQVSHHHNYCVHQIRGAPTGYPTEEHYVKNVPMCDCHMYQ